MGIFGTVFNFCNGWIQVLRIINTGGTFNKCYDPLKGELFVPADDLAVEAALGPLRPGGGVQITGTIYKDSLQMEDADRDRLCGIVAECPESSVVVVHGTDTIDRSAEAIEERLGVRSEKCVVLTGAMVPFSIDRVEATANLASAVTAARLLPPGVYIAMHGLVLPHREIVKNRERGVFERREA